MPIAKLQSVTSIIIILMSYEYVLDVCAGSTEVQKIITFHFFIFYRCGGNLKIFCGSVFCVKLVAGPKPVKFGHFYYLHISSALM